VHCAATPEGKPFTVDDVRRWHRQQGWTDIGYHYVVGLRGELWLGRDVDIQGAHCAAGGHNRKSIGVCYIGGVARDGKTPKDTRTPEQKATLLKLLTDLRKLYPGMRIYGHHDFERGKACPSFDAKNEYRTI
jgi:N-acetylmuramoyl-L-alanine amidase